MENNYLINEINKLKALISTLQQQLQKQQTEINLVKETALISTLQQQLKQQIIGIMLEQIVLAILVMVNGFYFLYLH